MLCPSANTRVLEWRQRLPLQAALPTLIAVKGSFGISCRPQDRWESERWGSLCSSHRRMGPAD